MFVFFFAPRKDRGPVPIVWGQDVTYVWPKSDVDSMDDCTLGVICLPWNKDPDLDRSFVALDYKLNLREAAKNVHVTNIKRADMWPSYTLSTLALDAKGCSSTFIEDRKWPHGGTKEP